MLVGVFTAILLNACVLEGTEDGVWSVVLVKILFVPCKLRLVVLEFALCRFELRPRVGDNFGLCRITSVGIGEYAVLDESDTEVTELGVDPVTDGSREVLFKLVDCITLEDE